MRDWRHQVRRTKFGCLEPLAICAAQQIQTKTPKHVYLNLLAKVFDTVSDPGS